MGNTNGLLRSEGQDQDPEVMESEAEAKADPLEESSCFLWSLACGLRQHHHHRTKCESRGE